MDILGISAYYHDSAACLVRDGEILAAAQEERFTRKKHDARFPHNAIKYCLQAGKITAADLDHVAFYDKPFLKFERLLETYLTFAPRGFRSFRMAIPIWLREKLFLKDLLAREMAQHGRKDWAARMLFGEHHMSHAASAFYPSPFRSAAILTLDGVGEWATASLAVGEDSRLEMQREIHFPHSIGMLYSAFTYYTGFRVNSGEYKVMGLAPYGEPRYVDRIYKHLIDVKEDGSFRMNQDFFDYCTGLTMTNGRFAELFEGPARTPEQPLTQRHMDLAASVQRVTEDVMLRLARSVARDTGQRNLCLAGGVALNCVANGKILRDSSFERIWVQPAAGDAGGALGVALSTYHGLLGHARTPASSRDSMHGSYLGPQFTDAEIEQRLAAVGARFQRASDEEVLHGCAQDLADGKAVGWFQGRMEFGPRALGARSILGDARSPSMQKTLNLKVKYRESFRPFAPSVLREDVNEWFDLDTDSPYMLLVADVAAAKRRSMTQAEQQLFGIDKLNVPRSSVPAITHVDYSARVQTVHKETNPRYHALLTRFKELTGCPVIVNTSFNVRGEPIVCTPEDAFKCFMGTGIERLVCGNVVLNKEQQNAALAEDYKTKYELD
jgi:carbamoyltransferase